MQFVELKPPLEELELELDDEVHEPLELEELVLLPVPELDEVLVEDELELLELEELEEPLIDPAEAVSVTLSSFDPSSLRTILSVCEPAARLLNVA